jgi:unsaturated rhamnogalacturonyl hydrolase
MERDERIRKVMHAMLAMQRRAWEQGVCCAPNFNKPGTATEGQAFFLLMEVAYRDLYAQ